MDRLKEMLQLDEVAETHGHHTIVPELEVYANSIEEALQEAVRELNCDISSLEYTILERGNRGVLGIGAKPYKILVKKVHKEDLSIKDFDENDLDFDDHINFIQNIDGSHRVLVRIDGVMLKVDPPKGEGKPVSYEDVIQTLTRKSIINFDESQLKKAIDEANGEWTKVGEYRPSPLDGSFKVSIPENNMKATVTLSRPQSYGRIVEPDEIIEALHEKGVRYGIDEEEITKAVMNEIYEAPVVIAKGTPPVHGKNAEIRYNFDTDDSQKQVKINADGSVDFHSMSTVQSVVTDEVLATKIPVQPGQTGRDIMGKVIPVNEGNDIELKAGANTHLSEDGMQIISDINGQVSLKDDKVVVEPILEIKGDVDLSTGDIEFPGSILVNGNINDTFSVHATGNLEVRGNVGKAVLHIEGDINVKQGIQGKDEAEIRCGGNLSAKFIERAKIVCEGYINVSEVILHSDIYCSKKIFCLSGKRAVIAGGDIKALQAIAARELGAESYTETILQVGIDLKQMKRLEALIKQREEKEIEISGISQQIIHYKDIVGNWDMENLSPEKQEIYNRFNKLTLDQTSLKADLKNIQGEVEQIQKYMDSLAKDARISAEKTVFPGVKITIKKEHLQVKNEFQFVSFYKEGANVKTEPYKVPEELQETKKT